MPTNNSGLCLECECASFKLPSVLQGSEVMRVIDVLLIKVQLGGETEIK